MLRTLTLCLLAITATLSPVLAQNPGPAVGGWRSLYSYYAPTSIASNDAQLFVGTTSGFFIYDRLSRELSAYSKSNGMSDVDITALGRDTQTGYTVIAYDNSNIDLFKDGSFTNFPEVKVSGVIGDKQISSLICHQGIAYLSTGLGIISIDLVARRVRETTSFYRGSTLASVYATAILGDDIYAATSEGLYRSALSNPFLQNYTTWLHLGDQRYALLTQSSGSLYGISQAHNDSLCRIAVDGTPSLLYHSTRKMHTLAPARTDGVWVSEDYSGSFGRVFFVDGTGTQGTECIAASPVGAYEAVDGTLYFVDKDGTASYGGLRERIAATESRSYTPAGPLGNTFFDVAAYNGDFWVTYGSIDSRLVPGYNRKLFSHYKNNNWIHYQDRMAALGIPFMLDAVRVQEHNGTAYVSSVFAGLITIDQNDQISVYRDGVIEPTIGDDNQYKAAGSTFDDQGTLWVCNYGATNELKARDKDGIWHSFHIPGNSTRYASDVVIDDFGNKWFLANQGGGVVVFSDNGTLANRGDDHSRVLKAAEGAGNLHDAYTNAIAKDRDGAIWVGTRSGIAIIDRPDEALRGAAEAELRVVQYDQDQNPNHLFEGLSVTALAVDGANRKWVGSLAGVWLISPDAQKVVSHFTEDNSPLPSNEILSINIDPITGDVYIGTGKGAVVYRGTASEPAAQLADPIIVYPNPVPSGFGGIIAIRGLKEATDVRITDISGQLIYRTVSNGGEAVWNGRDYQGKKAASGIYLVFAVDKAGTERQTGKIIIHE